MRKKTRVRFGRTYGRVEASPPEEDVLQHISLRFFVVEEGDLYSRKVRKGLWFEVEVWVKPGDESHTNISMSFPRMLSPSDRFDLKPPPCICTLTHSHSMFAHRAESSSRLLLGSRSFSSTPRSQRKHIDHYATLSVPRTATKAQIKVLTNAVQCSLLTVSHVRQATIR